MKSRRTLFVLLSLTILSFVLAQVGPIVAQDLDPTVQYQTVQAVIQQRFEQTATAGAARPSDTPTPNVQTATAEFETMIEQAFNSALTATAAAQPTQRIGIEGLVVGQANVNVRSCPTTNCTILYAVASGEIFTILLKEQDWYLIEHEEYGLGYIYAPLVQLPDNAELESLPTLTPSPLPSATPTATNTPLPPTPTPDVRLTATVEALGNLARPKRSGFYLVGVDIAPGKWESTSTGSGCYWARLDQYGDIIDNHYGHAGNTIHIQPSDYEIRIEDCGTFVYVENRPRVMQADAYEPKSSGYYTVGVEIAPGRWRSTGRGGGCYWARLDEYQDINANHFGEAGGTVYIQVADYEVEFSDCGTWEYLGP